MNRVTLIFFACVLLLLLWANIIAGLGPNNSLPFGYFGELNRAIARLEQIPGVDVKMHRDTSLEDAIVILDVDGSYAAIHFHDSDPEWSTALDAPRLEVLARAQQLAYSIPLSRAGALASLGIESGESLLLNLPGVNKWLSNQPPNPGSSAGPCLRISLSKN